ncbi:hypothetical protein RJT34_10897 [Clitoria ternatea]|uniref:Uncharacterized protein n=1 Tax=Clitoria ternatea TaxID=43366 RepID=A0AAN9PHY4_CLITE
MVGTLLLIKPNLNLHFSCVSSQHPSHFTLKPKAAVTITNPHPYWASLQADIEAHLRQAIPIKEPLVVFQPMHHLAFSAPRTTVPALCLAACELVGGHRHLAMPAASALLLIQAATHAHEHLPLTKPRPIPEPEPVHLYAPNIELLTGDGIVPFGFELLARSDDPAHRNSERILRVIIEISRAVGTQGALNAQYIKTLGSGAQSDGKGLSHVERIKRAAEKKEGGLHACSAACGAVLGRGSEEEIERLRNFGFYVGMMHEMLKRKENNEEEEEEVIIDEVRNLALKELQLFKDRDVEAISTFINF